MQKNLNGYAFDHVENHGCDDDDCIVIETAVNCADDSLCCTAVYKQTDTMFYAIMTGQIFESEDLRIICARCGAHAKHFRNDTDNV